jgi:hypothetical protein
MLNYIKTEGIFLYEFFIISLLDFAPDYFAKRLNVMSTRGNLILPRNALRCAANQIPEAHRTVGVNADIIIYVRAFYNQSDTRNGWAVTRFIYFSLINFMFSFFYIVQRTAALETR